MATISDTAFAALVRAVVIPVVGKVMLRRGYYAKLDREADDVVSEGSSARILIAGGILRDHAGTNILGGFALCGVPVTTWTGGLLTDVECRLCRKAVLAADRRRSRSHHPAGRKRPALTAPERSRCDD